MAEQLTEKQIALREADVKAQKTKTGLVEKFRKSSLPVDAISLVFSDDGLGVAVHMSRKPASAEIPDLPKTYEGVGVQYYTRENGQTLKLSW